MNNQNLFLIVWELGRSRSMPADYVSDEILLPGSHTTVFSSCPHLLKGARDLSGVAS